MTIIIKNVGQQPEVAEIENDLDEMQDIVGGYIETINLGEDIVLVCNEEGKLDNLPFNFPLQGDFIVGNAFFTKANDEGDFVDLNKKDIELIMDFLDY
jgi:uncharacterized protein (DUF736 family)